MKKTAAKITALLCAASFIFSFAGCSKEETKAETNIRPTAAETVLITTPDFSDKSTTVLSSDAPVFMLEKLPEIGGYVDDIICKRRYPETRYTLSPGEDYGRLIPFVGPLKSFNYSKPNDDGIIEEGDYAITKYGVMTNKGEIIIDAVYNGYHIKPLDNGDYIIELSGSPESKNVVFNSYGSWVRTYDSKIRFSFDSYERGYIIGNDTSNYDFETNSGSPKTLVYDNEWNKIFEFDGYEPCYNDPFAEGYMVVRKPSDSYFAEYYFVDTKGNFAFEGVEPSENFKDGKAIAKKDGLLGVFSIDGEWLIAAEYSYIYRTDNYFVASTDNFLVIYDLKGNLLHSIYKPPSANINHLIYKDKIFLQTVEYDASLQKSVSTYYLYPSEEKVICKETGVAANGYIYDTGYFLCELENNTFIIDCEGNTVAKLEGTGKIKKLDDEYFVLYEGDFNTDVNICTVYSKDFKKLWAYRNEDPDMFVRLHKSPSSDYITISFTAEKDVDNYTAKSDINVVDAETGKIVFEGFNTFTTIEINGQSWTVLSDNAYTYTYSPEMTLLMKVRNGKDD